jgi:TonB family protein
MNPRALFATVALTAGAIALTAAAPAQDEIWISGPSESEEGGPRLLNLGELVTPDDYPSQSVVADEQGTVGVSVKVDAAGRVADCMVEISSGFAALDAQTCRLFWLRAKFEPDHDAAGKPVASVYRRKITWRLEGEGMPLEAWAHTLIVTPQPEGEPLCRFAFEGALKERGKKEMPRGDSPKCKEVFGEASWLESALVGKGGKASLAMEQRFVPGAHVSLAAAPKAPGELMHRAVLHLKFDERGKVVECRQAGSEGEAPPSSDACATVPKVFSRPALKGNKPATGIGTVILTSYIQAGVGS